MGASARLDARAEEPNPNLSRLRQHPWVYNQPSENLRQGKGITCRTSRMPKWRRGNSG